MRDFMEQMVAFKINALVAGGLTIGSALLGFGGKIAIDNARTEQVQVELGKTSIAIRELRTDVEEIRRGNARMEEAQKINYDLLRELITRK